MDTVSRPPHGGRGLKFYLQPPPWYRWWSSPSRGTWIEMYRPDPGGARRAGRPPHGGRGLKYLLFSPILKDGESSPSRGTWIEIGRGKNR